MIAPRRHQLKFRVDPALASRVRMYCAGKDITETAFCVAAVEQYLAGTSLQEVHLRRLDRIARELSRLGGAIELLGETVATFVQLWLAHHPEIDERSKSAAQRDVARRYRRFVDYVLRAVRGGRGTLLHQLVEPQSPLGGDEELEQTRRAGASALAEDEEDV